MATPEPEAKTGESEAPRKKGVIGWIAVGAVAGAAGVAAPVVLMSDHHAAEQSPAAPVQFEMLPPERVMFLPFGEVTSNLNESRMNRHLMLKISLQIDKTQQQTVQAAIDKQGQLLKSWLLSHLADKQVEEIRGAAGHNMLRREIRDRFNTVLFGDGYDRIYDVLFDEFHVQ